MAILKQETDAVDEIVATLRAAGFHNQTLAVLPANCWIDADLAAVEFRHRERGGVSRLVVAGTALPIVLIEQAASLVEECSLSVDAPWGLVTSWHEYWRLAEELLAQSDDRALARCDEAPGLRVGPLARIDPRLTEVEGRVRLGPGARVDAGAVLRGPVSVGAYCRVGPGVTLERCFVEGGVHLVGPLALSDALVFDDKVVHVSSGEIVDLEGVSGSRFTHDLFALAARTAMPELTARASSRTGFLSLGRSGSRKP
jgi:hypothetical protein